MKIEITDEMVEAHARAMCACEGGDPDRLEPGDCPYGCDEDGNEIITIDGRVRGGPAHFAWRGLALTSRAALEAVAPLIADMALERAAEFADDAQDFALSRRIRALKEPTP